MRTDRITFELATIKLTESKRVEEEVSNFWHMRFPDRPRWGRSLYGKNWRIWKVARSLRKIAYGVCDRKIGPCPSSAARWSPLLLYHIEAGLSIGNLHKKKRAFSALFHDAINNIDNGKLLVAVKAGAEFLDVFSTPSAGVIAFILFTSAVRAFNFHSITTNSFQGQQGCIRLCIPQRNYHPRNSYSKPHRPWFPVWSGCTPYISSSGYSSSS